MIRFNLFIIGLSFAATAEEKAPVEKFAAAYEISNWGKAAKALQKVPDSPKKQLFEAFYEFNAAKGNKHKSIEILLRLLAEKSCPDDIRRQALLTAGRNLEMMRMRPDLYKQLDSFPEVAPFYAELIDKSPGSKEGIYAILFTCRGSVVQANKDKEKIRTALQVAAKQLETVGDSLPAFSAAVHWYLGNEYIASLLDYRQAVLHLSIADRQGLVSLKYRPTVKYQIARIYHKKLNDPEKALKYYRKFVQDYPNDVWTGEAEKAIVQLAGEKQWTK